MEVVLAVITLTTAVKDIVELGQKIQESFVKTQVPDNFRNAQRVAEDIKEMVGEISAFCDVHKGTLDNMKDFHVALLGLLGKFRSFETTVLPLLSQAGGRRRDRFIRGWSAWRNNNSIERKILDLQCDIVTVMRRFVWKSAMRAEVKLETIHQETSKGLAALEDIRSDMYDLRITATAAMAQGPFGPSGATGDEFNRNIILFAQSKSSTSVPMLRTPEVITEELMTAAYIKFQINAIALTITRMSALPAFTSCKVTFANTVGHFSMANQLELSMSITHLKHHIVRQVTEIRDLLANEHIHTSTVSIYDGSVALNNLANGLGALDMDHEALLVGKWAIMLAHIVGGACNGEQHDFNAMLAHLHFNQSQRYRNTGDMFQALQSVKEACTISQTLPNQFRTGVNSAFHLLHANVLRRHANLLAGCRDSIQMLVEAITILESILGVHAFIYCEVDANTSLIVQPSSFFVENLFSSSLTTIIDQYASTLRSLGVQLFIHGHEGALDLLRLAVTVYQKLVSIRGPEHRVQLVETLLSLVEGEAASQIPADELVNMSDECIQLLRVLAKNNPPLYARKLVDMLSAKASTLARLNQDNEAITAWEEAARIAEQIVQDSTMHTNVLQHMRDHFRRLGRYDDAVRTGKLVITTHQDAAGFSQARSYFDLSGDLQELRRYNEAVEAARTSVTLYRRLTMTDPSQWTAYLASSLSGLACSSAALGDTPGVLVAWREFSSILDNFLNLNSNTGHTLIPTYCRILELYTTISRLLKNKEDCHHVSSTAFRYCQQFAEMYPPAADMFDNLSSAQWCCAYNMLHIGGLQEANQYIDHWISMWNGNLTVIAESICWMKWHTIMITLKSRVLYTQGCTEEGLLATQKSCKFPRLSASVPLLVGPPMIKSMTFEAQMQMDLGNTQEALQVADEALQISRDNQQALSDSDLVESLHAVAFTALSCGNYTLSIEAAQEGCDICATSSWQDDEQEHDSNLRPSLLAILSSADANLARCGAAVEFARRAVDASLDIGGKWYVSAMTAEASYMETRGNLAEVLLATGDIVNAREICEQRRAYFSERVEKRMGEYRDLAPILRMLGILCCAEGHHEDGEAAAQELSEIMKKLGCAFPSLQEQVKIRLRRQANMPILKVLDDMTQKLDCKHQVKVSSLCEIQSTS